MLRRLLDLDTATTAETLGMPSGTFASHLHRGLAALRRDPAGLQATLRADGIPASVTFIGQQNPACQVIP